ncbi:ABC transporter ATP-binding protein [Streptomyces bambusae]|uniref:ABC transporter ATP-binding protein n=1 Tax=Streptomyces bambusae TaxID=1550616 RepID=UPI001CFC4938|nr:ABC transporter ATP-binding protein [Streptomyces bambusae]MCB5164426.1 ABC transporter ATP-binding protein [Streptomyces bambusae]
MTTTTVKTAGTTVVSFQNVTKSYGRVRAVDGLTLDLHPGETVALLGPNGAGKSSTLDLLLGLRTPDSGTVRLFGGTPQQALARGRVGAMLQSGGLMEEVSVRELVALGCALHPNPYPVDEVLARAGVTALADRMVNKLSGGQEQRVRFALATAGSADLIVLDEPTTGMDVTTRQAFWATMREQADQGRSVLFATHYLEEADAVADRVVVLHRGRLLADGTAAEIKAKAGARRISFDLDPDPDPGPDPAIGPAPDPATAIGPDPASASGPSAAVAAQLRGLPHLTRAEIHGSTVRLQSRDADATVHALYGLGLYPRNLEVAGLGLEQAFIALTEAEEARP